MLFEPNSIRSNLVLLLALGVSSAAVAGELALPAAEPPKVAEASGQAEAALKGFRLAPGFKAELIAAEPHLANPVAFCFDEQGRILVAEAFRLHVGVTDIRGHMTWLDEDLAARTPDDRLAMMKRQEGGRFPNFEKFSDRVKLLWDANGDGKMDESRVFADGFNHPLDGLAAGVLAHQGEVFFANLPNLWKLIDRNGDGVADERTSLSYGYGVRVGFIGHDLHGLILGPDGRLYFSIGDRGASVRQKGVSIGSPDTGSVFRCNLDGSELEEFATGLRNPQELAFDAYGNLFTGDNNSDGGDRARIVNVVEGGDSGWRVGFQFIERPNSRGPWNAEKMWHPQWDGQAAYIIPPILNLSDGPSGFAYYPGTGLPSRYDGHFFLADFHGGRTSGIHSFAFQPKGAGFELVGAERFLWDVLPTDVSFGPEPGLYYSDWVQGWGLTGKGRVYRVFPEDGFDAAAANETKRELAADFRQRSVDQLLRGLAQPDLRIRQKAQFELASRGSAGAAGLREVLNRTPAAGPFSRLHAVWGLGQIARREGGAQREQAIETLMARLKDEDDQIRSQSAKVLGELAAIQAQSLLAEATTDASLRVRMFAANALGHLGQAASVPALVAMLRENADQDPYLRHAAALALARIGDFETLRRAAGDDSPAVRMGVLLALRRLGRAEIAHFLNDPEPRLVIEAARAINDLPIAGAIRELAALESSLGSNPAGQSPELLRRVASANYRFGTSDSAAALGRLAAKEELPEAIRAEAIHHLATWQDPSGRDAVTGLWRPAVGARRQKDAVDALEGGLAKLLGAAPTPVRTAAARFAAAQSVASAGAALAGLATDASAGASARVEAMRALVTLKDSRLESVVEAVREDASEPVRQEALRAQAALKPAGALAKLEAVVRDGTSGEQQASLAALAALNEPGVDEWLGRALDRLAAGQVAPEIQLDLLEAAGQRSAPSLKEKLAKLAASAPADDPLAPYRMVLAGGNAEEGRKIFLEKAEASCLRCHKVGGEGGEVGPDLTGIGAKQTREYLLEAIVLPNKQIAQGFESLLVGKKDGSAYAGIIKSENDRELVLNSPEDGLVTIAKSEIANREKGLSAMPESLVTMLSRREIRDLIEYLAGLK